jgi:hypothetical protein
MFHLAILRMRLKQLRMLHRQEITSCLNHMKDFIMKMILVSVIALTLLSSAALAQRNHDKCEAEPHTGQPPKSVICDGLMTNRITNGNWATRDWNDDQQREIRRLDEKNSGSNF